MHNRHFIADRAKRGDWIVLRLRALQRNVIDFTAVTSITLERRKDAFPVYVQPHREVGLATGMV